ncbi:unnamed protein product [Cuscuta campestris]|uniref:RIN4 pathogenic type III effector avirulence factor Avr cleavage site domain-containing protein n=1 Tax=Cuscuta campestris TaxID=132261 RepID=A0A484NJI3_9ASTE|nr:unnamed protein product [Cuscuta campestris]
MGRPNVPRFGNWENEIQPYTVCFDQARKYKGGKAINPNDPQDFPEMSQNVAPSSAKPGDQLRRGGGGPAMNDPPGRRSNPTTSAGRDSSFGKLPRREKVASGRSHDSSHGRARLKPLPDQSPEAETAIPRFGEWGRNPQSAENYTEIFEKARKKMQRESADRPSYKAQKQVEEASQKCCFPW